MWELAGCWEVCSGDEQPIWRMLGGCGFWGEYAKDRVFCKTHLAGYVKNCGLIGVAIGSDA